MKKLLKKVLFFGGLLSLVAGSTFAGGVSVGNNKLAYVSPKGFSVAYRQGLTLVVNSDTDFRISNDGLVGEKDKTSRVIFRVTEGTEMELKDLREWLARQYIGTQFEYIKLPGAEGYYREERADGMLKGRYFLLTHNKQLVDIDLEAYSVGRGLELVAPIVHTFAYDITAPKVEAVWVENKVWPAGSKQKIFFRASDENSGLNLRAADTYFAREKGEKVLAVIMGTVAKKEEDGIYSMELEVGSFLEPATFQFMGLSIQDLAGNRGSWRFKRSFSIEVTNSGPVDTKRPLVHEVRSDVPNWKIGEPHRIYVRATDDVSGIKEVRCYGLVSELKYDEYPRYTNNCRNFRAEGGDWYSMEILLEDFLPSGRYVLDHFSVEDNAGNTSYPDICDKSREHYCEYDQVIDLPILKLNVENPGVVDVVKPEILEIRFATTVWKAGESQRIFFKMWDALSGLNIDGRSPRGWLKPLVPKEQDDYTVFLDEPLNPMGGDWYFMDITPNKFMKPRDLYLVKFDISDEAGNVGKIECGYEGLPKECKNSNGTTMAPVKIQISR